MLKIIIPIAGPSDLFLNAGYIYPKPLIEINGKTMIEMVIDSIKLSKSDTSFIFVIKEEDAIKFHLDNTLRLLSPKCEILLLKKETKGGLCSVLMAIDKISKNDELIILNGDQVIMEDYNLLQNYWLKENADAGLLTFKSVHPRWSYARVEEGKVVQTAEKNPISNSAIAGYYYFKNAGVFFDCAFQSIFNDVQLEGKYYISPVLNEYVLRNKKVLSISIKNENYHSFYSPQMIQEYEKKI